MYKLIAIDIDDTLLNDKIEISKRVQTAIKQAVDKGTKVVLCTGRTIKGSLRFYKQLGLDTLFITSGGAEIYDSAQKIVFNDVVDPDTTMQILKYAHDCGLHAQVYIDGELVYKDRNKYAQIYEKSYGFPGIENPGLMELEKIVTPKVLFVLDSEIAEEVRSDMERKFPSVAIKQSRPMYLEFFSPTISKSTALEFVADYYNIDIEDTIAIGDSDIDAPMIKAAGLGVAVANAPKELRNIADITCPSNNEDGVAFVIEKYILEAGK